MSKFIVVIFADEPKAYEGTRALKELDAEGSLTLYSMAVIARDASGSLTVKQAADQGPLGTAVGGLAGGLIGLLGGPVGAAIGLAGGALIGSMRDFFNLGVSSDFLDEISQRLTPGKTALIADVNEDWVTPLDTRMEAIGGTVLRTWRFDFEDEMFTQEVNALKAELAQLQVEYKQAREENRAKLKARVDEAKANLQAAEGRARAWTDRHRKEMDARIDALRTQAHKRRGDAREEIEHHIDELHADYDRRSAKLKQALELTKEALKP